MKEALENLIRITRYYVAPGIDEVDDAIAKARLALIEYTSKLQEGYNPRGPRFF